MKKTRRFAAIAAAAMMTAALAVPMMSMNAFAANTGRVEIVLNDKVYHPNDEQDHQSLKLYQIFTIADDTTNGIVVTGWGSGVNPSGLLNALQADDVFKVEQQETGGVKSWVASENNLFAGIVFGTTDTDKAASAQKVADVLALFKDNDTYANEFARVVSAHLTETAKTGSVGNAASDSDYAGKQVHIFSGVDYGYYVAVNTVKVNNKDGEVAGKYKSQTLGVLNVVGSSLVAYGNTKVDFPNFDKQILDVNDSGTKTTDGWNEAADHDMGDDVSFRLIATVPSNIDKYKTYKMVFHDNLEKDVFALDATSFTVKYYTSAQWKDGNPDADAGVAVNKNTEVDAVTGYDYAAVTDKTWSEENIPVDANEDFTITMNDIKSLENITVENGGVFVVEYKAQLTDKAKMGAEGNWNGAYLEYSNNPNYTGEGKDTPDKDTSDSPKDYVVAFTYQAFVNKIDGVTKADLAGADFTLYKKSAVKLEGKTELTQAEYAAAGGTGDLAGAYWYPVANKVVNDVDSTTEGKQSTKFAFNGLDDGTYMLLETTVPEGYNGSAQVTFEISTNEVQTDGEEAVAANNKSVTFSVPFVVNAANEASSLSEGFVYNLNEKSGAFEAASGTSKGGASVNIANNKGSDLPATGGIGTTLFYVVGGVLVVGAGVTLITKKRIGKDAE